MCESRATRSSGDEAWKDLGLSIAALDLEREDHRTNFPTITAFRQQQHLDKVIKGLLRAATLQSSEDFKSGYTQLNKAYCSIETPSYINQCRTVPLLGVSEKKSVDLLAADVFEESSVEPSSSSLRRPSTSVVRDVEAEEATDSSSTPVRRAGSVCGKGRTKFLDESD